MTLYVGSTTSMTSIDNVTVTRPNGLPDPNTFSLYGDLLATGAVSVLPKGVQIDVVPNDADGGTADATDHSGIAFNTSGPWQGLSAGSGNPLWSKARGWIFFDDGQVAYERWFLDGLDPKAALDFVPGFNWKLHPGLLATITTNPDGSGTTALYTTTGLGGSVTGLVASINFVATETALVGGVAKTFTIPTGDYAGCFVIGKSCTATFRPRAIFN